MSSPLAIYFSFRSGTLRVRATDPQTGSLRFRGWHFGVLPRPASIVRDRTRRNVFSSRISRLLAGQRYAWQPAKRGPPSADATYPAFRRTVALGDDIWQVVADLGRD